MVGLNGSYYCLGLAVVERSDSYCFQGSSLVKRIDSRFFLTDPHWWNAMIRIVVKDYRVQIAMVVMLFRALHRWIAVILIGVRGDIAVETQRVLWFSCITIIGTAQWLLLFSGIIICETQWFHFFSCLIIAKTLNSDDSYYFQGSSLVKRAGSYSVQDSSQVKHNNFYY